MKPNICLQLNNVTAGYVKGRNILDGIDLTVHENEIVAIVGQNGCGKSTLAKTIMGITPFRNGKILFKQADLIDKNFSAHQVYDRGIAYLMQESNVFNTLTISENLRFAARELDKKQYETKLAQLKELFDLFKNNRRWQMKASFLSGF